MGIGVIITREDKKIILPDPSRVTNPNGYWQSSTQYHLNDSLVIDSPTEMLKVSIYVVFSRV